MITWRLSLASLFFSVVGVTAGAQCPDGTPPPCKGVVSASAIARRSNPALNERAWIVVPFANVTKAPELDWLRDASVNLLSLDLMRWTDISVVDDKRVTDLVRELPPARSALPLSLNDGLALARRAGAGNLVMGDFFKQGKGARLVANVFDVKSGARLRSIAQQALDQDSLLTAFGPLARGVLGVPPPPAAKLGANGTTSVGAYQEYLLGVKALNRFELTDAKQHLVKALAFDSTFALAHFKLSMAIHWGDTLADTTERLHALAAARLGVSLPPRERALISGRVAASGGDYARACAALSALVAKDSADVEALYGVGECEYHGGSIAPEAIDSIHGRFRGNWNTAIAVFRRVLLLDPSSHPAFELVLDALKTDVIAICAVVAPGCSNDPTSWVTYLIRDGDSLLLQPTRGGYRNSLPQQRRAERAQSARLNLQAAQRIAQEWVEADPAEMRARLNLANVDLQLGDAAAADAELRQITSRSDKYTRLAALRYRVQAAILLARGRDGRAILDTLWRETPNTPSRERALGSLYAAFGQLTHLAAGLNRRAADEHWSSERLRYSQHIPAVMLGVPRKELVADERRYWERAQGDSVCRAGRPNCRVTLLLMSLGYAARVPRAWSPFRTGTVGGFRFFVAYALANPDSANAPFIGAQFDSISTARVRSGENEQGISFMSAEAYLAAHDSTTALKITRWFTESVMPAMSRVSTNGDTDDEMGFLLVPRMTLQRADLAAALGFPEEARTWYLRVLDLWAQADPELHPTIARIRDAVARLR